MYANAFKSGCLKEEVHGRLVQNLDAYARDAGIQPRWVWTPLAATCGQVEVNYVRQYPTHRAEGLVSGLLYLRDASAEFPNVDERMSAIAGAFTRNFIRARVMTLSMVLDHIQRRRADRRDHPADPEFLPVEGGGRRPAGVEGGHGL